MGYYTKYTLDYDTSVVKESAADISGYHVHLLEDEGCKWYQHEEDMKAFSLRYPNERFELSGVGEEDGDYWKKYFKNGKMQLTRGVITYDDFDAAKLK